MAKPVIDILAGKYRAGDAVLDEGPGAEILTDVRKYLPAFSDTQVIYRAPVTGNDSNSGLTELLPKKTQSAAESAAGSTNKIRIIESCTINDTINKPTEVKRGVSVNLESPLSVIVDNWSSVTTSGFAAGDAVNDVVWSQFTKKFIAVGGQATTQKIAHSADGDVFTQYSPATPNAGVAACVFSDETAKRIYVGTTFGNVLVSTDGVAFTTITPSSARRIYGFARDENSGVIVAACGAGHIYRSIDNGQTWTSFQIAPITVDFKGIAWSPSQKRFVMSASDTSGFPMLGQLWYSDDGYTWSIGTGHTTNLVVFNRVIWSRSLNKFIVRGTNGINKFVTSSDGKIWQDAATSTVNMLDILFEIPETGAILASYSVGQKIRYSYDADSSTEVTTGSSFGGGSPSGGAYSPILGRAVIGGAGGIIVKSSAYTTQILADVAGFNIRAVIYGGVKLHNCTMQYFLSASAGVSTECCRVKSGGFLDSDVQSHSASLFEAPVEIVCQPAASGNLVLRNNTFAGAVTLTNTSETYNETIQENVFEKGLVSAFNVLATGGNMRGGYSNVILDGVTNDDPNFTDEVDYIPNREIAGYPADSILVAASTAYVNTLGQPRDVGAWSFREENLTFKYRRHFQILKPSKSDSIKFIKHLVTSANPTAGGKPSVVNIPQAAWEELVLAYGSVNTEQKGNLRNQFEFLEYMQTQEMLDIQISWDGADAIVGEINLTATAQVGDPMITVAETDVEPGRKFVWFGTTYTVLRVSGNRLILDRDILDEIPNATEVPLVSPTGYGEYTMILEKDPTTSLNHFAQTDYRRGMTLRMARKCV